VRRGGRRGEVVADSDPGTRQVPEIVAGMRRGAGVDARLEVLLRAPGDAGVLQQLAEQRATAALRGTDEI
jgi:hypothetical protein